MNPQKNLSPLGNGDRLLLETARQNTSASGEVTRKEKQQLPGAKSRPSESVYATAKRVCNALLCIHAECLEFETEPALFEEEQLSASYPGLRTVYRKHVIEARYAPTQFEV